MQPELLACKGGIGVCAEAVERDESEVEQARVPDDKVQTECEEQEEPEVDSDAQDVVVRAGEWNEDHEEQWNAPSDKGRQAHPCFADSRVEAGAPLGSLPVLRHPFVGADTPGVFGRRAHLTPSRSRGGRGCRGDG